MHFTEKYAFPNHPNDQMDASMDKERIKTLMEETRFVCGDEASFETFRDYLYMLLSK